MALRRKVDIVVGICALAIAVGGSGCGNGSKSQAPTTQAEQAKEAAGGPIPASVNAAMESKYGNTAHPKSQGTPSATPPAGAKPGL